MFITKILWKRLSLCQNAMEKIHRISNIRYRGQKFVFAQGIITFIGITIVAIAYIIIAQDNMRFIKEHNNDELPKYIVGTIDDIKPATAAEGNRYDLDKGTTFAIASVTFKTQ